MARRYTLIKPVVGFWHDTKIVVEIPSGTQLDLPVLGEAVGICSTSWKDRGLFVFREDVERNAIVLESQR
jgi:hypothetical protein